MDKILKKSQKDYFKLTNRPKIWDIVTFTGFLRYTKLRILGPLLRDLSFLVLNSVEIVIIVVLAGRSFGLGGIIGYVLVNLLYRLSQALSYISRHKIILKDVEKSSFNFTSLLTPYINLGVTIWLLLLLLSFFLPIDFDARIIVVNKIVAGLVVVIINILFTAAYSITRIYIPLYTFIFIKILSIIYGILGYKLFGIYGFISSFYFYEILRALFMYFKIKNTLDIRKIHLDYKLYLRIALKSKYISYMVDILKDWHSYLISISLLLEPAFLMLILVLISKYYPLYLFTFFSAYQVLRLFTLPAKRLSRSIFFDTTQLSAKNSISLLHLYVHKTILLSVFIGAVMTMLFHYTLYYFVPNKYFGTLLSFILLDKWAWIYVLIFSSYIVKILSNFLVFTETYFLYLLSLFLEFVVVIYGTLSSSVFNLEGNPLIFFPMKGIAYFILSLILLVIFYFRLWIYFSQIPRKKNNTLLKPLYTKIQGYYVGLVFLADNYIGRISQLLLADVFSKAEYLRVSPNTIVVSGGFRNKEDAYYYTELLAAFSEKVYVLETVKLKEFLLLNLEQIFPKVYSLQMIDIKEIQEDINITFRYIKDVPFFKISNLDKENLIKVFRTISSTVKFSTSIPDFSVRRQKLIPIIKQGRIVGIESLKKSSEIGRYLQDFIEENILLGVVEKDRGS